MKRSKYGAKKTVLDGVTFDSKKEAKRYAELKLLEKAGEISRLELQPRIDLVVNRIKVCTIVPDFAYFDKKNKVFEDVKSPASRTPVYRLKRKLLLALHPGTDHREIY